MKRHRYSLLILLAALPLLGAGCPCEDPEDEAEAPLCVFLLRLIDYIYGDYGEFSGDAELSRNVTCPLRLECQAPYCIKVHENSGFEEFILSGSSSNKYPRAWWGDWAESEDVPGLFRNDGACEGARALQFHSTTDLGDRDDGRVSEVYQIIPYKDLAPPSELSLKLRVRVQAAFLVARRPGASLDDQFGIQIDAYAGDPNTFPRNADHERISASSPGNWTLLTYSRSSFQFEFGGPLESELHWQPLQVEHMLPEETDFFVVILEAHENNENDPSISGNEFDDHYVDRVDIVIDGGPYAPIASPDQAYTTQDTPARIHVLRNDEDWDGDLLRNTLEVVTDPANGTTVVDNGAINYTPDPGFTGTDQFTYVVEDAKGLRTGAPVTVTVLAASNRPPVATADMFEVEGNTRTVLDLLANDSDPDGDPITIIASSPNTVEGGTTEVINNGQAVRYTPDMGFTGTDTFYYVIADSQGSSSMETPVTVVVAGANSAPEVTDPINDFSVNVDPSGSCSFDLDDHFTDPDGDTLFYGFTVSSNAVTVAINGSVITVTGSSFSEIPATVTVIAQDTGSLNVSDTFEVNAALATDCAGNSAAP